MSFTSRPIPELSKISSEGRLHVALLALLGPLLVLSDTFWLSPGEKSEYAAPLTQSGERFALQDQSSDVSTDFFIMLPGIEMDVRNQKLLNASVSSVLALYKEEYVHLVHNSGDPTNQVRSGVFDARGQHLLQYDNFALGAFAVACEWMDRFRPRGNFVILQHSISLIRRAEAPACDIELVNLEQRCGTTCTEPHLQGEHGKVQMLTGYGTAECFPLLNDLIELYNSTCAFPCCAFPEMSHRENRRHFPFWPLMAHNAVLFSPRARSFLQPLRARISSMPPGTLGKFEDQATERLFGLFSSMLLEDFGPIRNRSVTIENRTYSNPLQAHRNKLFVCSQDLTSKKHGGLSA